MFMDFVIEDYGLAVDLCCEFQSLGEDKPAGFTRIPNLGGYFFVEYNG